MAETSLPWAGTTTGDAGPYSFDQWATVWRVLLGGDATARGVVGNYNAELEVTSGAANTVSVAGGAALVYGSFYENDASTDLDLPNNSYYYRIVLRKDWTAQTIRLAVKSSAVSTPAVTQSAGATWEISLATCETDGGGTVTVTDTRSFARVTIPPFLVARQGGSATDWNTAGTTNYTPNNVLMQLGTVSVNNGGTTTVTLPTSYTNKPIIMAQITGTATTGLSVTVSAITTSSFGLTHNGGSAYDVTWAAYGYRA